MNEQNHLQLDQQLCFSLYATSREVIKLYKPVLDEFNLTYTQYITMLVLWETPKITVKGIGQKLHLDSGTLTPLLKKLEQMELIMRYRDVADDRSVIIELTERGMQLRSQVENVPESIACQVGLNFEEILQLKKMLDELLEQVTHSQK